MVTFTVQGEPQGKGRPRFVKTGNYVRTYTPDKTVSYENLIKLEYERQCGGYRFDDNTPVDVRILAFYGIPKSVSNKKRYEMSQGRIRPIKKVDVDNLIKVVLDALNGVAYRDDIQVVDCTVRKFYSNLPRIVVYLHEAVSFNNSDQKLNEKEL